MNQTPLSSPSLFLALSLLPSLPSSLSAILAQWCEELGRLMLMRHHSMTARATGVPDMNQGSQQTALQIAQAAAAHAASQQLNKPNQFPHQR